MSKNRKTIVISWIAVLFWMVLIFNLSAQPATQSDKLSKGLTKVIVETVEKVAPKADFDISRIHSYCNMKSPHDYETEFAV